MVRLCLVLVLSFGILSQVMVGVEQSVGDYSKFQLVAFPPDLQNISRLGSPIKNPFLGKTTLQTGIDNGRNFFYLLMERDVSEILVPYFAESSQLAVDLVGVDEYGDLVSFTPLPLIKSDEEYRIGGVLETGEVFLVQFGNYNKSMSMWYSMSLSIFHPSLKSVEPIFSFDTTINATLPKGFDLCILDQDRIILICHMMNGPFFMFCTWNITTNMKNNTKPDSEEISYAYDSILQLSYEPRMKKILGFVADDSNKKGFLEVHVGDEGDQYCQFDLGGRVLLINSGVLLDPVHSEGILVLSDSDTSPTLHPRYYARFSYSNVSSSKEDVAQCKEIGEVQCYLEKTYGTPVCPKSAHFGDSWPIPYTCFGIGNMDPRVCSGHGICLRAGDCECHEGWNGSADCSQFVCFGLKPGDPVACNGNGECKNNDSCSCFSGWYVRDCSKYECFGRHLGDPDICGSHGECIGPNQCKCDSGWTVAENCSVISSFFCFGYNSTDERVCGSHGICTDFDTCSCFSGWYERNCSKYECFGRDLGDPDICGSHGECIGPNKCQCDSGWTAAENCSARSSFFCFGYNSTDKRACSSHGVCADNDRCECFDGYKGGSKTCSNYTCDEHLPGDLDACYGHGECEGPNICSCEKGWETPKIDCEDYTCFGVDWKNKKVVCGGHGDCKNVDKCTCVTGYQGTECSEIIESSNSKNGSTDLEIAIIVCTIVFFLIICCLGIICCGGCICTAVSGVVVLFILVRLGVVNWASDSGGYIFESIQDDGLSKDVSSEKKDIWKENKKIMAPPMYF